MVNSLKGLFNYFTFASINSTNSAFLSALYPVNPISLAISFNSLTVLAEYSTLAFGALGAAGFSAGLVSTFLISDLTTGLASTFAGGFLIASFAIFVNCVNAFASWTAKSAKIFLLISTFANF